MKALIVYCSDYKRNTEKIARKMAEKIGCELINIKDVSTISIEACSLIGFGSGVYGERLSPKLIRFVDNLNLKGINVFVFSTSGVGMKFYNNSLIRLLGSKGAIIKGSFACKGSFIPRDFTDKGIFNFLGRLSLGHPNDRDFEEAERFIVKVTDSL